MTTIQETQTWKGNKVVDADGDKIGTIEEIFLDRHGTPLGHEHEKMTLEDVVDEWREEEERT